MRKRIVIGAIVTILLLILGGIGGSMGYSVYRENQREGYLEAGDSHFEAGDFNLAKASYGLYLSQVPDDGEVLRKFVESTKRVVENRHSMLAQAATGLNQMLRFLPVDDPERKKVVRELASLYKRIEAWGDLQFFTQQQLRHYPEDEWLEYHQALALYKQSRLSEAERAFRDLVENVTDFADAYGMLASLLYDQRLESQARELLDMAVSAHPDDCEMLVERARYHYERQNQEIAFRDLDRALELDPQCVEALIAKADIFNELERYADAIPLASKAVELDSDNPKAYGVLSHAYQRTGRIKDAIELLTNVDIYSRLDHPTLTLALAEMQLATGNLAAAADTVEEYMRAYPTHMAVKDYFAGRQALLEGEPEEAIDILSVVYEEQPSFTPAHFYLIAAYLEAGMREEARTTLDVYLRTYPGDESARALLAREFGQYQDLEGLRDIARGRLANPTSTAADLVSAALPLFNAAMTLGRLDAVFELTERMLTESIQREPDYADAYRGLADVHVAAGNLDAAQQIIEQALGNGVSGEELMLTRANLKLKQGEPEAVRALFHEEMGGADFDEARALRWTSFLAARGEPALALEVLEAADHELPAVESVRLHIERARLYIELARFGDAQQTLDEIPVRREELAADAQEDYDVVRTRLARNLLRQPDESARAEGAEIVRAVIEDDPNNVTALLLHADLLLQDDPPRFGEAKQAVDRVLASNPDDPRALLAAANLASAMGDFPQALEYAERAVLRAPTYVSGQVRLAELRVEAGKTGEAELGLEEALEDQPGNVELLKMLTEVYLRRGNTAGVRETLAALEQVTGSNPAHKRDLAALHTAYLQRTGEAAEAEAILREAHAENPEDAQVARELAFNLMRQDQDEEATAFLEAWTSENPASAEGWIALSQIYKFQRTENNLQKASTALTRALVADPRNLRAIEEMVDVQAALGNYTDASLLADRYLGLRPDNTDMLYKKATFLSRNRSNVDKAIAVVSRAIALRDTPRYRSLRGFLYLEKGDHGQALQDLETVAQARAMTSGQLDLGLAEGYLGVGNYEMARRFYDLALEKADEGQQLNGQRLARVRELLRTRVTM